MFRNLMDPGTSYGYMGNQFPYIVLERPIISKPAREMYSFEDEFGIPSKLL